LPIIGLYALAGFRMMPAIQRISEEAAKLRGAAAMVSSLTRTTLELAGGSAHPLIGQAFTPIQTPDSTGSLVLENISYSYTGASDPALNGLNLRIELGQSVGIVGASGSGKSTLVDILLGLLKPSGGTLSFLSPFAAEASPLRFGYVPQQIFLTDESVESNIAYGVAASDIVKGNVEHAARLAQLHDFVVSALPEGYMTRVGERGVRLSGGQRQRIGIARALYREPNILVLDEATSALDNITEREVMSGVKSLAGDRTLVIVAHRLTTVRDCDVIFLLEHGSVVASGTYDELVKTSKYFAELAGHS
jgi:ABC-type multidrug transport system fused ATPase/permease subunit